MSRVARNLNLTAGTGKGLEGDVAAAAGGRGGIEYGIVAYFEVTVVILFAWLL